MSLKSGKMKIAIIIVVVALIAGMCGVFAYNSNQKKKAEVAAKKEAAREKKLEAKASMQVTNLTIAPGREYTMKLDGTEAKVKWSTDDDKIASINSKGVLTSKAEGSTKVTAQYFKKKFIANVTVKQPVRPTDVGVDDGIKEVFLTFDDGPSVNTAKILDILKQNGVVGTFFVTAQNPKSKDLMKRILKEGSAIGAHSYTHEYSIYQSEQTYFDDLNKLEDYIKSVTGKTTKIVRFPGGSSNTISRHYATGIMKTLAADLERKGYKYYDWNISSGDAAGKLQPVDALVRNATGTKHEKAIILMHDTQVKTTTVEALPQIIKWYKDNGYKFSTLENTAVQSHQNINN
ncbi:MAG TPA: polysaccharide deacetylase [Erysipelotrichaceae bacterium]|nr:polysaccharide deacetylase [Erysipelotrichaceae bacterium]